MSIPKLKHVPIDQIEMQKKLAKLFVLTDLLVSELDMDNVEKNETTRRILKKAEQFSGTLRPILDQFYQSKSVSKSTFFLELQQKFEYNFDKAYKKYKL